MVQEKAIEKEQKRTGKHYRKKYRNKQEKGIATKPPSF